MSAATVESAMKQVIPIIERGDAIDERTTRRTIIDPILVALGQTVKYGPPGNRKPCITEYYPYTDGNERVDYAMFDRKGQEIILIEAKYLLEHTQDHYEQLAQYGTDARDLSFVLTNGEYWNICKVDKRGKPGEEYPIGLCSRPVAESAKRLYGALSKDIKY